MSLDRRDFLRTAGIAAMAVTLGAPSRALPPGTEEREMYGLIGKMIAAPGQRDTLIAILLEDTTGMPGCLSYVIARDPAAADAIWITEVWDSEASHAASLSLPSVREAIAKARPLIVGFGEHVVTAPVGGHGLAVAAAPDQERQLSRR